MGDFYGVRADGFHDTDVETELVAVCGPEPTPSAVRREAHRLDLSIDGVADDGTLQAFERIQWVAWSEHVTKDVSDGETDG